MTGSSPSRSAIPFQIGHADSPQWLMLNEGWNRQQSLRSSAPKWWSIAADGVTSKLRVGGLPTTKDEAWKYTNLAGLHSDGRTIGLGPVDVTGPSGIQVKRFSQVGEISGFTSVHLSRVQKLISGAEQSYVGALCQSLVSDPFVIFVPGELKSDQPIEIDWRGLPVGQWGFGMAVVIVDSRASVSLLERYGREVDAQCVSTLIDVEPGAIVRHLRLQTGSNREEKGFVLAATKVNVANSGTYRGVQISYGSQFSREDLSVSLEGENADAVIDGAYIGRHKQLLDHHTAIIHAHGNTTSSQLYKGVLSDESRGVFNGRIGISRGASGSNSAQMNKNLLLSKKVEIDTKPELEIDNDDVKAAHGAAIGRLDAEHIFYLRSRGIETAKAVEILAHGYVLETVARLDSPKLAKHALAAVTVALAGLTWEAT